MKKLLITGLIAVFIAPIQLEAQTTKRLSAYNYLKSFRRYEETGKMDKACSELANAKENIDAASEHEQTNNDYKTDFYRAQTYQYIGLSKDPACIALVDTSIEPLLVSLASYVKFLKNSFKDEENRKLDIEKNAEDQQKFFSILIENQSTPEKVFEDVMMVGEMRNNIALLAGGFSEKGVTALNTKKNPKLAHQYFQGAVMLARFNQIVDTADIFYSGIAAEKMGDDALTIQYYKDCFNMGYVGRGTDGLYIASKLGSLYLAAGDTAKALKTLQEGRKRFPNDPGMVKELVSFYLKTNKKVEAAEMLEVAITKDPKNTLLHSNLGWVYDELGQSEKAEAAYNKSIEVDPENFDANFNLGVIYYNAAVNLYNKANDLPIGDSKYDTYMKQGTEKFTKAQVPFEKAHQLNPEDKATMSSLKEIYAKTNQDQKYLEMKKKLEN